MGFGLTDKAGRSSDKDKRSQIMFLVSISDFLWGFIFLPFPAGSYTIELINVTTFVSPTPVCLFIVCLLVALTSTQLLSAL